MPRYFFDITDGVDVRDDQGVELADLAAARAHAIGQATDYVSNLDGNGEGGYIVVTIRDVDRILIKLRLVCQMEAL